VLLWLPVYLIECTRICKAQTERERKATTPSLHWSDFFERERKRGERIKWALLSCFDYSSRFLKKKTTLFALSVLPMEVNWSLIPLLYLYTSLTWVSLDQTNHQRKREESSYLKKKKGQSYFVSFVSYRTVTEKQN
jgi:hypothetical protein